MFSEICFNGIMKMLLKTYRIMLKNRHITSDNTGSRLISEKYHQCALGTCLILSTVYNIIPVVLTSKYGYELSQ